MSKRIWLFCSPTPFSRTSFSFRCWILSAISYGVSLYIPISDYIIIHLQLSDLGDGGVKVSLEIFKMNVAGVLVSCIEAGNKIPRRCSGIRLSCDWVLTTGSILNSGLQDSSDENVTYWKNVLDVTYQDHLVRIKHRPLMETQVTFSVIASYATNTVTPTSKYLGFKEDTLIPVNKQFRTEGSVRNHQEKHGNSLAVVVDQPLSSDTHGKHKEFKSVLKYAWRSQFVSHAVDTMLSSWVMGSISCNENESSIETESEITKNLLSVFLLLKLQTENEDSSEANEYNELVDILHDIFEVEEEVLRRGQSVLVESTPFGNYYFHNSISEGVISNVFGPGRCLLLTDASTALGCEGGPISVTVQKDGKLKRRLVGMVVCSLSWWRGEWVGFTMGVALQPIVRRLLPNASVSSSPSLIPPDTPPDQLAGVDDCVVLVRCGVHWGSGVVVDSRDGVVLTCSHVVRNARNDRAQVYWNNRWYTASILFRSRDGFAYDVAVLRTGPGVTFRPVHLSSKAAVKGEPVIAAGFSLFSEDDNVRPTVTRGIVTLVSDPMAMLQTTCCVQSGASGGALFRCTGDLVGLISCNIMDTSTGALFPRINMAVPASVLTEPLNDFLRSGDVQFLSGMESKDPEVQRLWKLQSTMSKL